MMQGLVRLAVVAVLGLCVVMAACATTRQMRSVEPSGFLGDYSQLKKGEKGQARLVYLNPQARFSKYKAIMIDSVTLWESSADSKLSPEDQRMVTGFFFRSLHEALSKDWDIVDRPGPGVMRLRAALTEAKGARVAMNTVTSVLPQLRLPSTLLGTVTDTAPWVGKAAAEVEVTDSITDVRLLAAVDQRTGTKAVRSGLRTWSDVKRICEEWSGILTTRLKELRAST